MIPPISFIWKQLNGPQVVGITQAIFSWIREQFDRKLDYWNKFSIATAKDAHLTTIGALMGFGRPNIVSRITQDILFDSEDYNPSPNGFSPGFLHGPADGRTGGRFSDLESIHQPSSPISQGVYRPLLQAIAESKGEIGSLVLLDDILKLLHDAFGGEGYVRPLEGLYSFEYDKSGIPGNIGLDIGRISDWPNSLSTVALLNSICDGIYAPSPRVYVVVQLV